MKINNKEKKFYALTFAASVLLLFLLMFSDIYAVAGDEEGEGGQAVKLVRQYKNNESLFYTMSAEIEGTGSDGKEEVETNLKMDIDYTMTTARTDSKGNALTELEYTKIDIKMSARSGKQKQNRTIEGNSQVIEKKVDGQTVEEKETPRPAFITDACGELRDLDAMNDLLKRHPVLYFVVVFGVQALPDKPVKAGDKWQAERLILDTGLRKTIPMKVEYKLAGFEKKNKHDCALITISGLQEDEDAGNKFKQEITGSVWVDLETGCLVASEFNWNVTEDIGDSGSGTLKSKKIIVNLLSKPKSKPVKSKRKR